MLRIKRLLIAASLLFTLFAVVTSPLFAATTKTVCATGLPVTIPNNDSTGVTHNISIAESGTVNNIRLTNIDVTHGFIGEISASLTHGSKTVSIGSDPGVAAVTSPQGCKGQNLTNLIIFLILEQAQLRRVVQPLILLIILLFNISQKDFLLTSTGMM
ncbi:MAG: hypothetical protein R3E08_07800 [Thiotrichaceae bacterium]